MALAPWMFPGVGQSIAAAIAGMAPPQAAANPFAGVQSESYAVQSPAAAVAGSGSPPQTQAANVPSDGGVGYPQYTPPNANTQATNPAAAAQQQDPDAAALYRWMHFLEIVSKLNSDPVAAAALSPMDRSALLTMAMEQSQGMLQKAVGGNNMGYVQNALLQRTEGNPEGGYITPPHHYAVAGDAVRQGSNLQPFGSAGPAAPGPAAQIMQRLIPERVMRGQSLVDAAGPQNSGTQMYGVGGWQQGGRARNAIQNLPYYQQAALLNVALPEYGGVPQRGGPAPEPTEAMWQAAKKAHPGVVPMNGNPGGVRMNGLNGILGQAFQA